MHEVCVWLLLRGMLMRSHGTQPYGGGMFGRSLEETMAVETRLGGGYIPILLHRCITFLRQHGRLPLVLCAVSSSLSFVAFVCVIVQGFKR